ncbi:MAG: hypothetical protein PHG23_01070 [Candidatus Pacebacteria bacterium]|nr:hypothetical protein [Candidatus Paceibacterota bacterium]
MMFVNSETSVLLEVPRKGAFLRRIRLWPIKRNLKKIAQRHKLVLDSAFYRELEEWAGDRTVITFSRDNGESARYKFESSEDHFARLREKKARAQHALKTSN